MKQLNHSDRRILQWYDKKCIRLYKISKGEIVPTVAEMSRMVGTNNYTTVFNMRVLHMLNKTKNRFEGVISWLKGGIHPPPQHLQKDIDFIIKMLEEGQGYLTKRTKKQPYCKVVFYDELV